MSMCKLVVAAMLLAYSACGSAQTYPTRAVRVIVPFPPGGSTDILARAIGQKLSETWQQQVIIDNRPGAGGIIGTELGARAPRDGYTLLMGSGAPLTIIPSLYEKLPYDAQKDFAPITVVATVPNVLALHPSVPAKTVKELIALAKARRVALTFSSNGAGAPGHLAGELFKSMTGVDMLHVPYKGSAPATTAVVSGEVAMTFTTTPPVLPHAKSGRVRIIAVTTSRRIAQLPEVPTVAESGLPGYEAVSWFGLVAPVGVPAAIIAKINADAVAALRTREMEERLTDQGAQPMPMTPDQLAAWIRSETVKWAKIVKLSGAKPE
ncbi:MAG: Bug family tripartite tricarboxylate transporter substrate binding protein [Burkholderiales bacterium]